MLRRERTMSGYDMRAGDSLLFAKGGIELVERTRPKEFAEEGK